MKKLNKLNMSLIGSFVIINICITTLVQADQLKIQNSNEPIAKESLTGSESKIHLSHTSTIKHDATDPSHPESITRMQRVWTASSSGSLDELSPELISKLRQDIPFLEAYALRPRLVGSKEASGSLEASPSSDQVRSVVVPNTSATLLPKLGDFSEFNVDVSSTSKSEHHHRRKTSLKNVPKKSTLIKTTKSKMDKFLDELKLAQSKRNRKNSAARVSRRRSKKTRKSKSANKSNSIQSRKLIRRLKSGSRQFRSGKNRLRNGRRNGSFGRQLMSTEQSLNGTDSGTKGTSFSTSVKPMQSGVKPENDTNDEEQTKQGNVANSINDSVDYEDEGTEAEEPEPKRVGDPDVDPEGDTVPVMSKFDGVEDNPELPSEGEDDSSIDQNIPDQHKDKMHDTKGENDNNQGDEDEDEGEDGNENENENENENDVSDNMGTPGAAVGGGVGATTGGANSANNPSVESKRGQGSTGSGVDGDGENNDNTRPDQNSKEEQDHRTNSNDSSEDGPDQVDGQDIPRIRNPMAAGDSFDKPKGIHGGRDTIHKNADGKSSNDEAIKGHRNSDSDYDYDNNDDYDDNSVQKNTSDVDSGDRKNKKHGGPNRNSHGSHDGHEDCHTSHDYDHHQHDHGNHDGEHEHHHDKINWLRESIPGEPGQDYPILSRIHGSNFSCQDQRWPGYYADVTSGCQVFHICQADGRLDSFLCPNGTIFSQISRVCVWWNGFSCQDAPKYYKNNAQLFKQMNDLQPMGMRSQDEIDSDKDLPETDSFMNGLGSRHGKSMDSEREFVMPMTRGSNKSNGRPINDVTNGDVESAISSRLSSRPRPAIERRRRRRASGKQAPPKLKSRRVMRNSKRRIRHGVKPKRRA